jgi:hypothetical protein
LLQSTLAHELENELGWLRCNQDDLQGDRRLVEAKVAQSLSQGWCVSLSPLSHAMRR